jgi:anti-sigma regulatory factor (Ser/Thr protein kinase)
VRTDLLADHRAPAAARRFIAAALAALPRTEEPRGQDVLHVESELVTNAVRAGATAIGVELRATAGHVVLDVSDDAEGWPATRQPAWDEPGGRGLAIVEDVADEWHTTTLAAGKRVTASWLLAPVATVD